MDVREVSVWGRSLLYEYVAAKYQQDPGTCMAFVFEVRSTFSKSCESANTKFEYCLVEIKVSEQIWYLVLPAFAEYE